MTRAALTLLILVRLTAASIVAGLHTAWTILFRRDAIEPGIVEYRYEGLSPRGATALSYLLSLTPGSTSVDLDLEDQRLLVHLLDRRDAKRNFERVERHFEAPLRRLFPEDRA